MVFNELWRETLRRVFDECSSASPLRKLIFEISLYRPRVYGGEGENAPGLFYGLGSLELDTKDDRLLIDALKREKTEFCACIREGDIEFCVEGFVDVDPMCACQKSLGLGMRIDSTRIM